MDFDNVQRAIDWRWEQPLWKYIELYSERGRQMRETCKNMDNYIYNIMKNHRTDIEVGKKTNDFLTLFINAVDEDGKKLSDKELRDIILNLVIADALLKEINSIFSPETPIPSYHDVKRFKYTNATFYETLRLYPSVPKNGKIELVPGQKSPPEFQKSITLPMKEPLMTKVSHWKFSSLWFHHKFKEQ
ncbi:16659_t:CDS:2, partial [Racocetra fulgida]